ncbi:MAG: caspase family protein [Bacteroidetes bacterium]|nr:caspase family protein [Bacteroidota bacterium]
MKAKISLILLICTLLFGQLSGQNSEQASKINDKANQAFTEKNFEVAIKDFLKAAETENKNDNPDPDFMGSCYENTAYCYYQLLNYQECQHYFQEASTYYQRSGNSKKFKTILNLQYNLHALIRYYDAEIKLPEYDKLEKYYVFYSVDSIVTTHADTMWIYSRAGLNENIYQKHNAFAISIHNSDEPERGSNTLGKGKLVSIGLNYSIYAIVIANPNDKSLWPRIGDILQITCEVPEIEHYSVFKTLASYNIVFKDLEGQVFYDIQELLFQNRSGFDDALIDLFVEDLHQSYTSLIDYEEPALHEELDGGKFKGLTLLESLREATNADVSAFLNFVSTFPAKYMGKQWKILETFATWVINNTPAGEYDPSMLEKLIQLKSTESDAYIENIVYYVDDSTFYKWNEYANQTYLDGNTDEAYELLDQFIKVSKLKNDSVHTSIYLNTRGYFLDSDKKYEQAIESLTQAVRYDPSNVNAYYQRGNIYASIEKYGLAVEDHKKVSDALPDVAAAWGNQGWYLILDGRVFQAQEVCQKAYELDSLTMSWAVNLGHTYLLTGDTARAFDYYEKTLDLLDRENEFWEGPVGDFNIFLDKKWKTDLVSIAKSWMIDKYKTKQYFYLQADSLADLAIEYKDKAEYAMAAQLMLESYEVEKNASNPRDYWLYWETSWLGYIYQQMADWEHSIHYYELCLDYAQNHVKDQANVANALDLLSWMYKEKGDMGRYYSYLERSEALQEKIAKQGKSAYLYLVAIGINQSDDVGFQYASQDALSFTSVLKEKSNNLFDSVIVKYVSSQDGSPLDFEEAIKEVILYSKPNDAFIFYMAGSGLIDTSSFHLLSATSTGVVKEVDIRLLKTWMSNIQANNQLIILDMFAPTFISEYLSTEVASEGIYSSSNQNLTILCPKGHRIEIDSLQHGLFTFHLLKAMQGEAASFLRDDALISIREMVAYLNKEYDSEEHFLSHVCYSKGRDFYLTASSDSVRLDLGENAQIIASRGAGLAGAGMLEKNYGAEKGKDFALLFATDKYSEWEDLVNPINDATTLANTLEEHYGFEVELIKNASRREVMSKIREYQMKSYEANDQLFIFFAGHGSYDEISGEGYLVCKDSEKNDEIMESYIPYSYLREHVNNIRSCKHILIALDVCFGGTFDKRVSSAGRGESLYENVDKAELIRRAKQYKSRLFLTSGGKQYVSDGDPGKHSPFAYQLLAILRTESQVNGYVTFNKLVGSVERLKTTPRFGDFGDNEPGGEFIFNVKSEEKELDRKFKDWD